MRKSLFNNTFKKHKNFNNNYKKSNHKTNNSYAVVFKNVKKIFSKKQKELLVLNNLSFNIYKGKITAILGSSGAGKTTTAKIINGLETYNSGNVFINGVLLKNNAKNNNFRKQTAFVFQNFNLFPHLSILENIIYTPIKVYHQDRAEVLLKTKRLLRQFNLDRKADCYPSELSGGQKQRAAIIRALILEPDILIMDEPTASLDPEITHEVTEIIKTINKTGITIIVVTHDIVFAKKTADYVLMLHNGKVVDFMQTKDFFNINKDKSFYGKRFLKNCF